MWIVFLFGAFVGSLGMIFIFAPMISSMGEELRDHKKRYGYTYHDVLREWKRGCDGHPPTPPPPT